MKLFSPQPLAAGGADRFGISGVGMLSFANVVVIAGPWVAAFATLLALLHALRSNWTVARMVFAFAWLALCLGGVGAGIIASDLVMLAGMGTGSLLMAAVLTFEYARFDPEEESPVRSAR